MKIIVRVGILVLATVLISPNLFAAQIVLENGDKLTGEIVTETDEKIFLKTDAMGVVTVKKEFIVKESPVIPNLRNVYVIPAKAGIQGNRVDPRQKHSGMTKGKVEKEEIVKERPKTEKKKLWQNKVSLGYVESSGNTESSQGNTSFLATRKSDRSEVQLKQSAYYASDKGRMNGRKFNGMMRYAFSFGRQLKWYSFTKLEGSQDRFAKIDYRLTPSFGLGYWFSNEVDWKSMAELAAGFEHTNYRSPTETDNEMVLIPRGFLEKQLTSSLRFAQDLTLYPMISDFGEYRLKSESSFVNKISDQLSLKLSLEDDYNSQPAGDAKKNDMRFISALEVTF